MSRFRIGLIVMAIVALGGGGALYLALRPAPVCPLIDRALTRDEVMHAARGEMAMELNRHAGFLLESLERAGAEPSELGEPPVVTADLIAELQSDCCSILWDWNGRFADLFDRHATDEAIEARRAFVQVEVDHPDLLTEANTYFMRVFPVDRCGNVMPMQGAGRF